MADFKDTRVSEKRFYAIPAQALTADGASDGTIKVANTYCWKVGQIITCVSAVSSPRRLKIKAVLSETDIKVGDIDKPIYKFTDVSDLLVADNAMIELHDDNNGNKRPTIDLTEIRRQIYEEEPTLALRSHLVDWLGRSYSTANPIPVQLSDGDINIGTVNAEVEVQLSHQDNVPDSGDVADSVQIGDGTRTANVSVDNELHVKNLNGMVNFKYDYVSLTQGVTFDTWTFKTGGSGGTTVGTITINYTSSSKKTIQDVIKT